MVTKGDAITDVRWRLTLHSAETLADDLGLVGCWVGPRTGPDQRTHGQKEDYVLRRLLAAWRHINRLAFPVEIRAEIDAPGRPDFALEWTDGQKLGIEVTEAGTEAYQKWMTRLEGASEAVQLLPDEFVPSSHQVASEIAAAICSKVEAFDSGKYRDPSLCDLLVYDNSAWGGFLDKQQIVSALSGRRELTGRFRRIHIVFGEFVQVDLFGNERQWVDVRNTYEIDYAGWIADQVQRLRSRDLSGVDATYLAEELEDLGRSERRAVKSHLKNLLVHLLKWQFQPKQRGQSWSLSIRNARVDLYELLSESPSLRKDLGAAFSDAYAQARRLAAEETGIKLESLPEKNPYPLETVIDPNFMPD